MIRRPPRSTLSSSSAASDVYKRQMMACFGSIGHIPIATMLMVAEMTGNLSLLAPAMVAVGIATLIVGDRHIYASQLRSREDAPAHRFRFGLTPVGALPISAIVREAS